MGDAARPARFDRLYGALKVLLVQERFTLPEMKERLPEEIPGYITRLVHRLQREGHLRDLGGVYSWTCELSDFPAQSWVQAQVHGTQLLLTPEEDRPRERLLARGAASLRTAELLAVLIRSGRPGESALQAGEKIAARYGDQLDLLPEAGRGELKALAAAVGETAYCQIMAGIELGRRVAQAFNDRRQRTRRILGSDEALAYCRERFGRLAADGAQEEFHIVCLDTRH